MSENLKEYQEAVQMRQEVQDNSREWLTICDEAAVIMEAKKIQEEELKSNFRKDGAWDATGRKSKR